MGLSFAHLCTSATFYLSSKIQTRDQSSNLYFFFKYIFLVTAEDTLQVSSPGSTFSFKQQARKSTSLCKTAVGGLSFLPEVPRTGQFGWRYKSLLMLRCLDFNWESLLSQITLKQTNHISKPQIYRNGKSPLHFTRICKNSYEINLARKCTISTKKKLYSIFRASQGTWKFHGCI